MSSVNRPTAAQKTRRLLVVAAAVFSIVAGQLAARFGLGQGPAEFASDGDTTLRVAGYAFAIWGVIYLGIFAYAVRQVLPQTAESELINRFGWPSILALVGIGAWIVAAGMDWELATIVLITGSAVVLIIPLLTDAGKIRALPTGDRDRWLTAWPMGLLAGWLSIAAPLNLITVATGNGDLPTVMPPTVWAALAVAAVAGLALFVTWQTRFMAYAIPIAWGLLGAFVAEQPRNPTLAYVALIAAIVTLLGAVLLVFRLRPGVERHAV